MKVKALLYAFAISSLFLLACENGTVAPEPVSDPVANFHLYQEHSTVPTRIHVTGSYIGTLESYVVDGVTYQDDFTHYLTTPGVYQVTMTVSRNDISTSYSQSFEVELPTMIEGDYISQYGDFTGLSSINNYRVGTNINKEMNPGHLGNTGYFSVEHGVLEFTTLKNNQSSAWISLSNEARFSSYYIYDNNNGYYYHLGSSGYTVHNFPTDHEQGQFVDWDEDGDLEIITASGPSGTTLTLFPLEGATVREDLSETLATLSRSNLPGGFQILQNGDDLLLLSQGEYYSRQQNQVVESGLEGINFVAGQFDSNLNDLEWFYVNGDHCAIAPLDGGESTAVVDTYFKYRDHKDVNNDGIDDILLYLYSSNSGGYRGFLLLMSTSEGYKEIPINFYNRDWQASNGMLIKQEGQDGFYVLAEITNKTDGTIKQFQLYELDR